MALSPKDLLRQMAQTVDNIIDMAEAPLRQMATSLGLPTPPERPKLAELVETLPEVPGPAGLPPVTVTGKEEEAFKIKEVPKPTTRVRMRFV